MKEVFKKIKLSSIKPEGWIKEFLDIQELGLSGNIEVSGYPYNTCMWAGSKIEGSPFAWWPYEQTAYYLDGINRLGILNNSEKLKNKVFENVDYVVKNIKNNRFQTPLNGRWWRWPYASFNRILMTLFEETNDFKYVEILKNHYLTFNEFDFQDDLELANVEELAFIYEHTKNDVILKMAINAFELFKNDRNNRNRGGIGECNCDMVFDEFAVQDQHGVVFLELIKIPLILYKITENENYLNEAINGLKSIKNNMLISGLPDSTEHIHKIHENSGTETCNTAVFVHTYDYFLRIVGDSKYGDAIEKAVFNGGLGCISKDFKAHQYFSSPNQFIASMNSNPYGHHQSRTAFLAGHDVECCTGNVNRFMPYYVGSMYLKAVDGIVASLYGPSSLNYVYNQNEIKIIQKTDYPFDEVIDFEFELKNEIEFSFYVRIPEWCNNPKIYVNGIKYLDFFINDGFLKITKLFKNDDVIKLFLKMEVVISQWFDIGVGFERGPLVFSYPIEFFKKEVEYEKSNDDFKAYEYLPIGNWNYGFNGSLDDVEVITNKVNTYPWISKVISLKIPVFKIKNWSLKTYFDDRLKCEITTTPSFLENMITLENVEFIELVPYGNTMLRLTIFPKI